MNSASACTAWRSGTLKFWSCSSLRVNPGCWAYPSTVTAAMTTAPATAAFLAFTIPPLLKEGHHTLLDCRLFSGTFSAGEGLPRERIRAQLQLVNLRLVVRAAFVVEVGARARGGPHRAALPAGLRIVDAPVDVLGEEAERVRNAEVDDLAVDHRHQRLAAVGLRDRHVGAQPERVVAIDPDVIGVVGAAGGVQALELRPGHAVERPALGAELAARRLGAVERALALAPVEARDVPARERRPHHAVGAHVDAARTVGAFRRNIDLGQRRLGRTGSGHDAHQVARLVHAREADAHRLAPDRIVDRARRHAVESGPQARVAVVANPVAVAVDHDRRPALRGGLVAGLEVLLRVH